MMKKLLSVLVLCLVSVTAFAQQTPFKFMPAKSLELARPYIDLEYTNIHGLTLEKADKEAYFEGGLRYYYGYTKRLDIPFPKDYPAAAMWFYEAGMKDHPLAAYYLGNMYIKGQGTQIDYKSAIWWLEKAYKLGVQEAGLDLADLYYNLYQQPQTPESYKDLYLERINYYLNDLISRNDARATFNKGLMLLQTQDLTRFVIAEAQDFLLKSLELLIQEKDQVHSYEVLKVLRYYKMSGYESALENFNNAFPSRNKQGF